MARTRFERRTLAAVLGVLTLLAVGGCATQPASKLITLENAYFTELFEIRPTYASAQGMHQYDGRLDDVSALALGRRADELGRQLARLRALQSAGLDGQDRIDGKLLENAIRGEILDLRHRKRWNSEPAIYFEIVLNAIERTVRRPYAGPSERLKALVISINEIEAVMAAMRMNVVSPSQPAVEEGLESCSRLRGVLGNELPEWGRQAAGVDGGLARSFEAGLGMAVSSLDNSHAWLEKELLPIATHDYRIGAANLVMAILFDSMAEIRLGALKGIAEEMLKRDYAAFVEAAGQVAPGKTPAEALETVARPAGTADFPADARSQITAILQRLSSSGTVPLPDELATMAKCHVEETWPSLRSSLWPYRVDLPAMEGGGERRDPVDGYLLISPPAPDGVGTGCFSHFSPEEMLLAAAASIAPGRYLQSLYTLRYPTRSGRLLTSRVTRDGWAHYSEQLAEEALGGNDPRLRLILFHRAVIRDCRFFASIGIHAMQMSEDNAVHLFAERALLGRDAAAMEVRRVITDPMCLSEALGKHLILQLRTEYEEAARDTDPQAFHAAFLKYGALPVPMIRARILPPDEN